jgi:hypothetical protein
VRLGDSRLKERRRRRRGAGSKHGGTTLFFLPLPDEEGEKGGVRKDCEPLEPPFDATSGLWVLAMRRTRIALDPGRLDPRVGC